MHRVASDGEFSGQNQDENTSRVKLPAEEAKSPPGHLGLADNRSLKLKKFGEHVPEIKPEKGDPGFSFYSSIDKRFEEEDLDAEEAKVIRE